MSCTVNEYGYDFSNGKTIMTADDGYAYSKEDFGIEDVVREVHDLVSSDDESGDEDETSTAAGSTGRLSGRPRRSRMNRWSLLRLPLKFKTAWTSP